MCILIVRTDGIGDFVFFSRFLPVIRKQFPNEKLVLCCRQEVASLARLLRLFDAIVEIDLHKYHYNYLYRFASLQKIRSFFPSIGIYATFHRSHTGDEMVLFSGASETMAFSGNTESIHPSMLHRDNKYFSAIVVVPDHSREHDKYMALLNQLGIKAAVHPRVSGTFRDIRTPGETEYGRDSRTRKYGVLAPGSGGMIRRWPVCNFSQLADRIVEEFDIDIVLCGSTREHTLLSEVAKQMRKSSILRTDLTIVQVLTMIGNASFFVGNDSGLLHLAASVNTPSVGIIGGGHFTRYFPYGSVRVVNHPLDCYECNWKCIYPEPYCITNITVEEVLSEVRILQNPRE